MLKNLLILIPGVVCSFTSLCQPCTPLGDQVSYGSNNIWIGYVYDNPDFTNYMGFVNEGTAGNANFSQDFGGSYVNYPTNGCTFYSETFSVRYKLTKTFAAGTYKFTISGDDRIRLSIDGGATWLVNLWAYNGYLPGSSTVNLNGTYNMVLEYMDGAHQNRVFFNVEQACTATVTPETYGTITTWKGYLFEGVNFEDYKGMTTEAAGVNLAFSQNFGGAATLYPTSDCPVFSDFFSVRYKLRHTFPANSYTLTVSGDDKYRLSLDGGSTWVIDRWALNAGNTTRMFTSNLSGTYDIVLEYYEKDGSNYIQFSSNGNILLPLNLEYFSGRHVSGDNFLTWKMGEGQITPPDFEIERSDDGRSFQPVGKITGLPANGPVYSFTDKSIAIRTAFYRIKIIDQQGKVAYSKVISIVNEMKDTKIYPTLISNETIYLNNHQTLNNAVLVVNDMAGRRVGKKSVGAISAGQTTGLSLNELQLRQGIYIIQLLNDGKLVTTQKIVIR